MSLLEKMEQKRKADNDQAQQKKRSTKSTGTTYTYEKDIYKDLKDRIHGDIIQEIGDNHDFVLNGKGNEEKVKKQLERIINTSLQKEVVKIPIGDYKKIINELFQDIFAYGPITPLLEDESISEIMVNGCNKIFVERKGMIEAVPNHFRDNSHLLHVIEKIVTPLGRRIDESSPMVDARLPDGSRVNAVIHPIALEGPTLTIRKFAKKPLTIKKLIQFNSLNNKIAVFLKRCVLGKLNIIISGGTGSGKTTLLNCLSSFIPHNERIITIEDAAELQLMQPHVVRLEARPPNVEGKGAVTINDLVRNTLRMRPDRIVVGEVRGGEALDMLQAMNTGHSGSISTIHANTPHDALARLETMVLLGGVELPLKAIRQQVVSAIDIIVQTERFRDGKRRISYVTEVLGMEGDVYVCQDIFRFEHNSRGTLGSEKGAFIETGIRPKVSEKLEAIGV